MGAVTDLIWSDRLRLDTGRTCRLSQLLHITQAHHPPAAPSMKGPARNGVEIRWIDRVEIGWIDRTSILSFD